VKITYLAISMPLIQVLSMKINLKKEDITYFLSELQKKTT